MESSSLCQYLEWDSTFFGLRIARVTSSRLRAETVESIMRWCDSGRIDCLYLLADAADPDTVRLAEDHGFRFVDIRATYEWRAAHIQALEDYGFEGNIRPHRPDDVAALLAIARESFIQTRFYFDSHFPRKLSDGLYETWTEKSCNGYADIVLVAESGEKAVGFVSCHLRGAEEGQVGLVGVDSDRQGLGVGGALIRAAQRWFRERGVSRVEVVTQGRNCRAQRLYQRSGFVLVSEQLWYHRWFMPKGSP